MKWIHLLLVAALAGCSGGTGTGGASDPASGDGMTDPPTGGVADAISLPLTGRASYVGQMTLGLEAAGNAPGIRTAYAGDLSVAVDFGGTDAQVTGQASNFAAPGGASTTGSLFLTRGEIDRAAATGDPDFAGRLSGTLREGTDSYLIFGQFTGEFKGPAQEVVAGTLSGNVLRGSSQTRFDGSYQAGQAP